MSNIKKSLIAILAIDLIYLLIFTIIFLKRTNIEFLVYVGAIILLLIIVGLLALKFRFSTFVLVGLSLVGFLHMLGGAWIINGLRLYRHYFVFGLIKYDLIIHFLGVFFGTLLFYEITKPYLKTSLKTKGFVLFLMLFLAGTGIGGLHEIMEFILVLLLPETGVGSYENTMWDLVANAVGAFAAFIWVMITGKNGKQAKGEQG